MKFVNLLTNVGIADTSDGAIKSVLTSINTEKGYRGNNKDKCVRFDTNAKTLIFDDNKEVCDTGVGTKPVCKKHIGTREEILSQNTRK